MYSFSEASKASCVSAWASFWLNCSALVMALSAFNCSSTTRFCFLYFSSEPSVTPSSALIFSNLELMKASVLMAISFLSSLACSL